MSEGRTKADGVWAGLRCAVCEEPFSRFVAKEGEEE